MDSQCRKALGGLHGRSKSIRGFYVYAMSNKVSGWFPHDIDSTDDIKMQRLIDGFGCQGYGIFWRAVEVLHKHGGTLDFESLVFIVDRSLDIGKNHYGIKDDVPLMLSSSDSAIQAMCSIGLLTNTDGQITNERVIRNLEYRQDVSDKRSQAGRIGGIARASKSQANAKQVPSKSQAKPSTLTVTDTVTVTETEEREEGKAPRSLSVVFKPPTIEDVQTMFRIRGLPDEQAELFHSYYESQGWVKANGQPVRNWQQLIPSWATKYHKDKHNEQKHKRANGDRTHEPLTAEGLTEYRERTRAALNAAVETFQRDRTNEVDGRTNGEAPSVPALRIRRGDKWVDPNAIDP